MVRIYNNNGPALNAVDTVRIEEFKTHSTNRTRYFTDRGVFEMDGKNIRRVLTTDGEVILTERSIGDDVVQLLVDTSSESLSEYACYQIPFGYVRQSVEVTSYRVAEHAQPRLVIVRDENGSVVDYYIDTTMSADSPDVTEAVSTLLMQL